MDENRARRIVDALRERGVEAHLVRPGQYESGVRVSLPDGREANRQFWTAFFAALPDLSATMEDLVISGDRVVGRFVYRGTHTGELMGIPASGNAVEMRSIDIWRAQDGMFVEHWDELNLMEVFAQVGALPPLGAGAQV